KQHDALRDCGDLRVGHRRVAGSEVDEMLLKLLYSGAAAQRLVIDLNVGMGLVIFREPLLIERRRESRASALQGNCGLGVGSNTSAKPRPETAAQGHKPDAHQRQSNKQQYASRY